MRFRDHADIHFLLQRTQSVRTKSAQTDDQGRASRGADKFAFFHDASAGADQQRVVHGLSRVSGNQLLIQWPKKMVSGVCLKTGS